VLPIPAAERPSPAGAAVRPAVADPAAVAACRLVGAGGPSPVGQGRVGGPNPVPGAGPDPRCSSAQAIAAGGYAPPLDMWRSTCGGQQVGRRATAEPAAPVTAVAVARPFTGAESAIPGMVPANT
jgi:hypothetical protein